MPAQIQKIREFIFENFLFDEEEETLDDNDSFLEQGIIDSTGILELIDWLAETFGITIEETEIIPDNLDSVNRIVAFVQSKKS